MAVRIAGAGRLSRLEPADQEASDLTRESWDLRYSGRDLVWTARPNQFLLSEVGDLAPGTVLDLGCGEGRNAVWLAEQGWAVTAVDFSAVGIEKGREMASRRGVRVDWVVADLNDYEPLQRAFDLVIDFYLQVPPDQRGSLTAKAASAVADGGTLLIVGHDLTNLADGYGGPQNPALLHSPETIVPVLDDLDVLKAVRVKRRVESDDGEFEAIDTLVRATRPVRA